MKKRITFLLLSTIVSTTTFSNTLLINKKGGAMIETIFSASIAYGTAYIQAVDYAGEEYYEKAFSREYSILTKHKQTVRKITSKVQEHNKKIGLLSTKKGTGQEVEKLEKAIDHLRKNLRIQNLKLTEANEVFSSHVKNALASNYEALPKKGVNYDSLDAAKKARRIAKYFYALSTVLALDVVYSLATESRDHAKLDSEQLKEVDIVIDQTFTEMDEGRFDDNSFNGI